MEKRIRHLEMIQGIINRLSTNSFLLKGWTVLLVSALFALAANDSKIEFAYLAYFPVLAFWSLDGYFLWQERLYRNLYDRIRTKADSDVDFSMNTSELVAHTPGWRSAAFSPTLLLFHGTITATVVIVMLLLMLH